MKLLRRPAVLSACLLLAACAGADPSDESLARRAIDRGTEIWLPDGLVCKWMPDVSPDGPYDCGLTEEGEVRLAAPPLVAGTTLRATVRVLPVGSPARWEALVAEIDEIVLAGGAVCRSASGGPPPALDGERADFTCVGAAFDGSLGSLQAEGGVYVGNAVGLGTGSADSAAKRIGRVPVAMIRLREARPLADPLPNPVDRGLISPHPRTDS